MEIENKRNHIKQYIKKIKNKTKENKGNNTSMKDELERTTRNEDEYKEVWVKYFKKVFIKTGQTQEIESEKYKMYQMIQRQTK